MPHTEKNLRRLTPEQERLLPFHVWSFDFLHSPLARLLLGRSPSVLTPRVEREGLARRAVPLPPFRPSRVPPGWLAGLAFDGSAREYFGGPARPLGPARGVHRVVRRSQRGRA